MAADRRNLSKAQQRSSPLRRDAFGYGDERELRRDRSPIRGSPRRDSRDLRDTRDSRDGRNPRDARDQRDAREPRDARDIRDARDARDLRDARERDIRDPAGREPARDHLADRFRDGRDPRDLRDVREAREPLPVRREDPAFDRLYRMDDLFKKKDEPLDRFRDAWDSRTPRDMEDRLKREERRREELCRQYFEELQRRYDNERPVDCSVIVVNKQTKDYAESVGRKVRDLGMVVDLIFLNTEVSLTQALEDVGRGGTPFAIVITQQHQVHRSCTVNILFGTPQVPKGSQMSNSFVEHRNMPLADAMVLVARTFDRYKSETRDKEREDIARQAAKMADEAILQERERSQPVEDPLRGAHPSSISNPPSISPLMHLLAEGRYVTMDELDRVIDYLREKRERMLRGGPDPLLRGPDPMQASMSRQGLSSQSLGGLDSQSSLQSTQLLQSAQPLSSTPVNQSQSSTQQELQAKILSLFSSGVGSAGGASSGSGAAGGVGAQSQSYTAGGSQTQSRVGQGSASLSQGQPRMQTPSSQLSSLMAAGSRPSGMRQSTPQLQSLYSQQQNRMQTPGSSSLSQRGSGSSGINFDNPSVQKALDTLIQSGPALSHLVSQATPQVARPGQSLGQSTLGSYQRHY